MSPPTSPSPPTSHTLRNVGIAVIVVVLVIAGVVTFIYYPKAPTNSPALTEGGFTMGQVVTFDYNGSHNWQCTPNSTSFFPNATSAARAAGGCEVGNAVQTAVTQVPEWVLVPAFAGLSVFGVTALGASPRGFPMFQGSPLLTDCGAGTTPTACVDHPPYIYSPDFSAVEVTAGVPNGYGGLPLGVLPTPAHDHLINTATSYPNVEWGTIAVLVFDPNIWPARDTGACSMVVADNLSSPTAHCLTTLTALEAAIATETTANAAANGGTSPNPIWTTLGNTTLQVVIPGVTNAMQIMNLNSNLYIPFSVSPGAPSSFPS